MSDKKNDHKKKPMTLEATCQKAWHVFLIGIVAFYVLMPVVQVIAGSSPGLVFVVALSVAFIRLYLTDQTELLGYSRGREKKPKKR